MIPAGESRIVEGVEALDAGEYAFVCSVHPNMTGRLTVLEGGGEGAPEPPPTPEPDPGAAPNPLELMPKAPARPLGSGEWPSYGRDLSNSRNGGTAGPAFNEIPRMAPVWVMRSSDGDFTGTPVVKARRSAPATSPAA